VGDDRENLLNLQTRYDLEVEKDRLGDRLDREVGALAASR
jgi:hypothetical protein